MDDRKGAVASLLHQRERGRRRSGDEQHGRQLGGAHLLEQLAPLLQPLVALLAALEAVELGDPGAQQPLLPGVEAAALRGGAQRLDPQRRARARAAGEAVARHQRRDLRLEPSARAPQPDQAEPAQRGARPRRDRRERARRRLDLEGRRVAAEIAPVDLDHQHVVARGDRQEAADLGRLVALDGEGDHALEAAGAHARLEPRGIELGVLEPGARGERPTDHDDRAAVRSAPPGRGVASLSARVGREPGAAAPAALPRSEDGRRLEQRGPSVAAHRELERAGDRHEPERADQHQPLHRAATIAGALPASRRAGAATTMRR